MRIGELPLAEHHISHFQSQGIKTLYPPQTAAVEAGVCQSTNLLAAVPTASGKSLIATLGLLTADGPGVYICPLRALAREQYARFATIPGIDVALSIGARDKPLGTPTEADIIVATSEKIDAAIRASADWLDDLACMVVDEIHLIDAPDRGPTLEMAIALLRRQCPEIQVIGLSATIANPEAVATWLDATAVVSTWRPVELREGQYRNQQLQFTTAPSQDLSPPAIDGPLDTDADEDHRTAVTTALVTDATADDGQTVVFVRSRHRAEQLAAFLAEQATVSPPPSTLPETLRTIDNSDLGSQLAAATAGGVGFHHAGLSTAHQRLIETAFRERNLGCLCATPTLAAGVNLPARRVIIADLRRYTGDKMDWLPVREVQQMMGRAGRPGRDPHGEAILLGPPEQAATVADRYRNATPETVSSHFMTPTALRMHVLALIATGVANRRAPILTALEGTFFAHQSDANTLAQAVEDVMSELESLALIETTDQTVRATPVGDVTTQQYLRPQTAATLVDDLHSMAQMDTATRITVLEALARTPEMPDTYLSSHERAAALRFARDHEAEILTDPTTVASFEEWLCAIKVTQVLTDWLAGATQATLTDTYQVAPGDLERWFERATWLLRASEALAGTIESPVPHIDALTAEAINRQPAATTLTSSHD